jgi:genome maintenance exonuclease 1
MENYKQKMMPSTLQLFKGIQPIIDRDVEIVHGIEIPLFSHKLRTAGRCDLFCRYQGLYTIADFKTSTRDKKESWIKNYFLQATAYAIMIEEMYKEYHKTPIHIPQLAVIIAVEDGDNTNQLFVKQTKDYRDEVIEMFANYHDQHQMLTVDQFIV